MFEKIQVSGSGKHPLYEALTSLAPVAKKNDDQFEEKLKTYGIKRAGASEILWNFEKFLVRDGKVIARFSPEITPEDPLLLKAVEAELK
jgi:glutathione peroxidase